LNDDDPAAADAEIARELGKEAGGYLWNVVREPHVTCAVCGTPIQSEYTYCATCNGNRYTNGVADLVVPLVYCVETKQSYEVFRGYKDHAVASVRDGHMWILERLLYLGIIHHNRCIERRIGAKIDAYVAVPSLSGRKTPHPFVEKTAQFGLIDDSLCLVAAPNATSARVVAASQFHVLPEGVDLTGQHIVVLDDTWTRGSRTQSATLALRKHGAKYVTILTMARYLVPTTNYANNDAFIKKRLQGTDYDPLICPVTGGDCP
jgi:phosphoribosylpyrophosphate synthetase